MLEKQLVVNNQLLNYLEEKTSDTAPAVVFLHGWQASSDTWRPIIYRLKEHYNLYALDLPGFGKSEMPKLPMTVADYAQIVKDFTTKLELKNVTLVGHSFGGRIAQKCSAEHFLTISRLVLVDSSGFRDGSMGKMIKVGLARIAKPFVPERFRKKISKAFGATDYAESGELRQTFINVINEDQTEDMKKIEMPTLIVWGQNDKETPLEFGERMHALIRDSKFEILPGAAHYSFLDKPEEFTRLLASFV